MVLYNPCQARVNKNFIRVASMTKESSIEIQHHVGSVAVAASEQIRKRGTKGNKMETSRPLSKKRKVSKEDETQLELREPPSQECISVDLSQK